MAKKIVANVKLQVPAGKATPAPPVGSALGPHGLNIMDFCKAFNAKTAKQEGLIIPVVVTVYRRPHLYLCDKDAAGGRSAQESGQHCERFGRTQQEQGWQGLR